MGANNAPLATISPTETLGSTLLSAGCNSEKEGDALPVPLGGHVSSVASRLFLFPARPPSSF